MKTQFRNAADGREPKLNFENFELVFVRLGPRKNHYLNGNIDRLRNLFPELQITVILDSQSQQLNVPVKGVKYWLYANQNNQNLLHGNVRKSNSFRDGFWTLTTERLFAVLEYQSSNPNLSILHIESDVLLFPNFPFAKLKSLNQISWSSFNETKDVASIFFLPSVSENSWLKKELQEEIRFDIDVTDMTALSIISQRNPNKVYILPPFGSVSAHLLVNHRNHNAKFRLDRLIHLEEHFSGIFDPAAIGMWLCGLDPENFHGKLLLHDRSFIDNGDSFIDPSALDFQIDSEGNLFFLCGSSWIPIYNLHVHSKNQKLLSNAWLGELRKYVNMARKREPQSKKNLGTYWSVLARQGTTYELLHYLGRHPQVYPLAIKIKNLATKIVKR